jgi:hypothetical protein
MICNRVRYHQDHCHRVGIPRRFLDNPYDDAPALEDVRLLARLSRATKVVLFQLSEHVSKDVC